jgi:hypothetical protein
VIGAGAKQRRGGTERGERFQREVMGDLGIEAKERGAR